MLPAFRRDGLAFLPLRGELDAVAVPWWGVQAVEALLHMFKGNRNDVAHTTSFIGGGCLRLGIGSWPADAPDLVRYLA